MYIIYLPTQGKMHPLYMLWYSTQPTKYYSIRLATCSQMWEEEQMQMKLVMKS